MLETIQTKQCSHCKQNKPTSEFYKNRSSFDGFDNYCKSCKKIAVKNYINSAKGKATRKRYEQIGKGKIVRKRFRQSPKGIVYATKGKAQWRINHPDHNKASRVIQNAVQCGRLPAVNSLQCSCGHKAEHYHHDKGYEPEHWFDVIPVCYTCHLKAHNNNFRT